MSVTQLIDIILINPTVHLTPSGRDTGFTASYTFEPLSNLVYTRDQQVGGWGRGWVNGVDGWAYSDCNGGYNDQVKEAKMGFK